MLLTSAVDLTSLAGNPTTQEGWGRLQLEESQTVSGVLGATAENGSKYVMDVEMVTPVGGGQPDNVKRIYRLG